MLPINVPSDIDKYFFNRTKDIKRITRQIDSIHDDLSTQLLITGLRGVGKTFLLKKILNNQPDSILTVYLDISKIYGKNQGKITESEVLKAMLNQLYEAINTDKTLLKTVENNIKQIFNKLKLKNYDFNGTNNIFNIPLPVINDNYEALSDFVMKLPQRIVDSSDDIKGIVIVMDEFQLLKYINNPEAFFWLFRSYSQEESNICYIFTGSVSQTADIIELLNGQTGAFGGRMIQINIEPFTKEETKEYINKNTDIKFTTDGFDRFYKCTRGIPAYINPFCNILVSNKEYTSQMIKESFLLQMDQIIIMWLYVWGSLNEFEKNIIILLVENDKLSWNELLNALSYSKATLTKYIDSLNNKGIVKYTYDKQYSLNDQMLRTWLIHKKETEGNYPL